MAKGDKMVGIVDRNGKGDKRRPLLADTKQMDENAVRTFGEDWLIPPVLRRRRQETSESDNA